MLVSRTKISIILILLNISINAYACKLQENVALYSLSGPITFILEELELLDSKNQKGISVFHPVRKSYLGNKLGGGIFLTPKAFRQEKKKGDLGNKQIIVFYDESKDITKNLSKIKSIKSIEVVTRGHDAFDSHNRALAHIRPFLQSCEQKLTGLKSKVASIRSALGKVKTKYPHIIFYLGIFNNVNKRPNLVMVNDGFVKSLTDIAKIKSYPSQFSYISWSKKIIKKLGPDILEVGVASNTSDKLIVKKLNSGVVNIHFRGALIPGIRQVLLLEQLIPKL